MEKKIVLIDGNSVAYRAFFALPLLNNDKGIHTNAIYGFAMMLDKILAEEKPSHVLVAFDAGKTTFRHETFEEYKGGRQKTPPELSEQFPYIRKLLDAHGIRHYELENFEADDIIGTLSKQAEEKGYDVKIVSGDRDLTQLATDKTTVLVTKKGVTDMEKYTPEHIQEKYGISPLQIIDMKGLMGDTSDNIPGVPGIGEKTAIKLLKEFESVEKVLDSIEQVKGKKLKENLTTYKDQAILSKKLATIYREAPIEVGIDETSYSGPNKDQLVTLYKELGFQSLLDKLDDSFTIEEDTLTEIQYEIVENVTKDVLKEDSAFYVEIIEDNYHYAPILGFSISNEAGNFYIPFDVAKQSADLKAWLEDESMRKYVYDAKRTIVALNKLGIGIQGIEFDLLLASYILNPSENIHDFSDVAKAHNYNQVQSDDTVYGKGAKRQNLTDEERAETVVRKAKAIYDLKDRLISELEKNDQYTLFTDLEMPLSVILANMESVGVRVDIDRLKEMGNEFKEQLKSIEEKIYELAGETFNINSPKQLGVILFEKLGLPVIKKTKTGYSTSADVLEKLESKHEIVALILHYRQLGKLQSTYIEGLLKMVNPEDQKVHTRFQQALTQTGRLSSTDPNLQNIPIRMEEGRKIRQAFVPSEKDWVIFSADYSQIELRVLAHISGDERLIDAFKHEMDIHTKTAMDVFHVEKDEVTSNMRRQAKAVNFGIVYGISDYGLSQSLKITRKEAGEFIERYFQSYPQVKQYMEDIVQEAKLKGYVTTLLNRRRYIPEITSRNYNLRSFAERTAMNTPIQGSAADIIKKAMIDMAARLEKEQLQARLLLQVHDELIFEAPKDEIEKLIEIVPDVMENAVTLDVPLKVDYSYGPTWFDAK
ncbi:DNA polymerase I [Pallidibacillus thermolactis]|uniref:DNA polymerase I n=1 Tax=Pallidibacillus thermolactis TaxID=251051 RepID=UPI00156B653B|nr:DNA polymerase I [Pallidibacillus thermolactis]MCU9601242.1 DNA polymerase I [Pallidibacillus thermolactis subsp. kokeshiiformis]MED1673314.1 DNA polymerase I [Pallidibacillus thermolactis subsp. kokeshiiformis]